MYGQDHFVLLSLVSPATKVKNKQMNTQINKQKTQPEKPWNNTALLFYMFSY